MNKISGLNKALIFAVFSLILITLTNQKTYAKVSNQNLPDLRTYSFRNYYKERGIQPFSRKGSGRQKFALVIGQNDYPKRPLKTCVNDALKMSKVLNNDIQIPQENIRILLNRRANIKNIKIALSSLSKISKPGDMFFFYYSGHGIQSYDKSIGEKTTKLHLVSEEKISSNKLYSWIQRIKAVSVFIFDSCYAAGMISNEFISDLDNIHKNEKQNSKMFFVASSGSNQLSMTIPLFKHSRFTYFFSLAMKDKRADLNNDGKLSLLEIFYWSKKYTVKFGDKYGNRHDPIIYGNNPEDIIIKSI